VPLRRPSIPSVEESPKSTIEALVFSPDSRKLAVEDTSNVMRLWDTCAVCENANRLSQLAAQQSVRELTPGERATFGVR
jgi:hypothetical protein